jgi:hypothetical protein
MPTGLFGGREALRNVDVAIGAVGRPGEYNRRGQLIDTRVRHRHPPRWSSLRPTGSPGLASLVVDQTERHSDVLAFKGLQQAVNNSVAQNERDGGARFCPSEGELRAGQSGQAHTAA